MKTNKQVVYKRLASSTDAYVSTSQYPIPSKLSQIHRAEQTDVQQQERYTTAGYGYTVLQGEDRSQNRDEPPRSEFLQISYDYPNSSYSNLTSLQTVPYETYYSVQTNHPPPYENNATQILEGQDGLGGNLPIVSGTPEDQLEVMYNLIGLETTTCDSRSTLNNTASGPGDYRTSTKTATVTTTTTTTTASDEIDANQVALRSQTTVGAQPAVILERQVDTTGAATSTPRSKPTSIPSRKPTIPAPVKTMNTTRGRKNINNAEMTYVTNEGNETDTAGDDSYNEVHAAMDGRQSSSERPVGNSEREEEIDSPVCGGTPKGDPGDGRVSNSGRTKKNKKKRRHRRTSSSSDSSIERPRKRDARRDDSSDSEMDRVRDKQKKSSRHKDGRKEKHGSSRSRRSVAKSPSRSRSVSLVKSVTTAVSPDKSKRVGSGHERSAEGIRSEHAAYSGRRGYTPAPERLQPSAQEPRPPLPTTEAAGGKTSTLTPAKRQAAPRKASGSETNSLNNMVYNTILENKSKCPPRQDADNMSGSVCTVRSNSKRPLQLRRLLDAEALEAYLIPELRGLQLSRDMITNVLNHYTGSTTARNKVMANMLAYVTVVDAETNDHPQSQHRIQLDTRNYPLHSLEIVYGYDSDTVNSKTAVVKESLLYAMWAEKYCDHEHSLDRVLRTALKEMICESNGTDRLAGATSATLTINGRCLEFQLLGKIRCYYMKHFGKDIIRCLMPSTTEEDSFEQQNFIIESASRCYIRRLIGQYRVNPSDLDQTAVERTIYTPKDMRVWTDMKTQRSVNVQMKQHIETVFDDFKRELQTMDVSERDVIPKSMRFVRMYVERSREFMRTHNEFLSYVLRASELMAWMCFGVTTNQEDQGLEQMALSYLAARSERKTGTPSRKVCWNYPLASIFFQEEPATRRDLPCRSSMEVYWNMDSMDLDL